MNVTVESGLGASGNCNVVGESCLLVGQQSEGRMRRFITFNHFVRANMPSLFSSSAKLTPLYARNATNILARNGTTATSASTEYKAKSYFHSLSWTELTTIYNTYHIQCLACDYMMLQ